MKKSSSISEALRIAKQVKRKRYALGGPNYGQEAYNQLLGDLEARKKLPLPTIAPLAGPSQSNTQTPDAPATPADKTPDVPASDTTNIRRPIEGSGGGDNFAPSYQNMPTGVAPSLPSSMPETIDLTTGQPQSGKTGFGPLDRAIADPVGALGNAAFGFVPVLGPLSTVSGMFGGPTFMSLSRGAINSLSKDSQPTGAIPSNVQNFASDEVDGGGGDSPTGSGRGTTTEGLHDRAMAQYAASKGHTLGQDPNADRLAMAAMMYGETRGKGDALGAGMSAVNRSLATGQPIGTVIGKPNQYEGYSPASLQAVTNPASIKNPIERAAAMASLQKATDLMTGKAEATHGKGTPYGNVTSFNKAPPAYNYNTPSQGAVKGSAVVGEPHTFYTVNNLAGPLAKAQARMEQAARAKAEQEQQAQVAQQGIGPGTGTPGGTGSAATPSTSPGYGSAQVASNDPGIGLGGPLGGAPSAPSAPSAPAAPSNTEVDNSVDSGAVSSPAGTGPAQTGDVTGAPSSPGASPSSPGSSATTGSTSSGTTPGSASAPTGTFGISLSAVDPDTGALTGTVTGAPLGQVGTPTAAPATKGISVDDDEADEGDDSDSDSDDGDSDSNASNNTNSDTSNSGFSDGSIGGESYGGGWGGSETSSDSSSTSDSSSNDGSGSNDGGGGGGQGDGNGGMGEKRGGFVRAKMPKENPMVKKALKIARSREAKTKKPTGRSIVDKALVLTSKSANRQRGRP